MDNASPSTEQPTPGTPPPSGPRVTRDEIKDLVRLRRSVPDRHVAGVAGGLARHLDVDPIIVRVALVVSIDAIRWGFSFCMSRYTSRAAFTSPRRR